MNKAKLIGSVLFTIARILFTKVEDVYALNEPDYRPSATLSVRRTDEQTGEDARVLKLAKYLTEHNSPLIGNAEDFVRYADIYGYGQNWSMVAAIAGVESTFGKNIPANSYNAWGWGIPTGASSGIGFKNWEEGIKTVSQGIRENYMDNGAETLAQIGRIYAPPSYTWAGNVSFFMNRIETTSVEPSLTL